MKKVGILGGGQLGRMLLQASANYVVETFVLENDLCCPAAHLCHHFVKGDITNYNDVYNFGKGLDALTIEIESVNVEALECLEAEGVRIYPKPSAIKTINEKILQKEFYRTNEIPSSGFIVTMCVEDLAKHINFLPAVHKISRGGYDGRGVQIIKDEREINKGFDAPAVLEKMVNVQKEIAIIVAMNNQGKMIMYPPVEMILDPHLNLLDFQISPAYLSNKVLWKIEAIAAHVVKKLQSAGVFAIELFICNGDEVLVNETAPRVHNSGHHTIEANYSSQYDMLWRIMLDMPLGNPKEIIHSSIVNILGSKGHNGEAVYEGLEEVLKIENVFVHLYGKKDTKPGRKMGHVTILGNDRNDLIYTAHKIKNTLKVVSSQT